MEYAAGALEAVYHAEGRVTLQNNIPRYEYVLRDHLGNGRVFFTDANADGVITAADILQDEHYYPFGLSLSDPRRVVLEASASIPNEDQNKICPLSLDQGNLDKL